MTELWSHTWGEKNRVFYSLIIEGSALSRHLRLLCQSESMSVYGCWWWRGSNHKQNAVERNVARQAENNWSEYGPGSTKHWLASRRLIAALRGARCVWSHEKEKDNWATELSAQLSYNPDASFAFISLEHERVLQTRGVGGVCKWTNRKVWFMNTSFTFHPCQHPCFSKQCRLLRRFVLLSLLLISHNKPQWDSPLSRFFFLALGSICAVFAKGFLSVTWTEWMGLIAFNKVKADLHRRKWIEFFLSRIIQFF